VVRPSVVRQPLSGLADNRGMARPLRFVPPHSMVEVTTRTMQGRLLLRPSPELTEIILGIIGKAQDMYGMAIHAFVSRSTKNDGNGVGFEQDL
jgi:hypothetical protein